MTRTFQGLAIAVGSVTAANKLKECRFKTIVALEMSLYLSEVNTGQQLMDDLSTELR